LNETKDLYEILGVPKKSFTVIQDVFSNLVKIVEILT